MPETALLDSVRASDAYRADGPIHPCPRCGLPVRHLGTEEGDTLAVVPFPLRGNWGAALPGYDAPHQNALGEDVEGDQDGPLWVLPLSASRASASGWEGGARLFDRPPPTVQGYREHARDCPP